MVMSVMVHISVIIMLDVEQYFPIAQRESWMKGEEIETRKCLFAGSVWKFPETE